MSTPPPFVFADLPLSLPAGYAAVPLVSGGATSSEGINPLRAAVVLSTKGDPSPVVLRELLDARTYLACEIDAAGRVHGWLELWVQEIDGLANSLPAYRQALNNKTLDARWTARAELFESLGSAGLVRTGFEEQHPPPMFIDAARRQLVTPAHEGGSWALCTSDADLSSGGLPAYSSGGQRFLYVSQMGAQSPFVPATRDSGADSPQAIAQQVGASGSLPLNPGAGLLMLRPLAPFPLEAYADAISGFTSEGLTESMLASLGAAVAGESPAGGFLYLGEAGRVNRPAEILHLKLKLFADVMNAVRTTIARTQRPMLNVSPASFRVSLGLGSATGDCGLPYLWTGRAELVETGEAVELPVKTTSASFFMASGAGGGPTIYTAGAVGRTVSGRGLLRIRKTIVDGGLTMVEATLTSSERFTPGRNDLVWIHFSAGGGRFDLYGLTDEQRALAGGELRFRTIAQRLGDKESGQLKAAEGIPIQDASFEVLPQLSSPCDLYSLAVLAVRLLLTGGNNTLAVALDEMMSLTYEANGTAGEGDSSGEPKPLHARIKELLKDQRWSGPLGPQRLLAGVATADDAFEVVPIDLWARALAMIVRMFPGIGPESRCRDFGDATPGGLHKVFDRAGADLAELLTLSRGLVIGHQRANREIASIVAGVLARA